MKRILMCPPDYYNIEYVINPWMDITSTIDREKVQQEYNAVKNLYKKLGLEVFEIEPIKGLPDMVYSANYGYAEGTMFIKSNFKYGERKKEADYAADFFKKQGFTVLTLPKEIDFEGEGDLLRTDSAYFMGWGKRTSREAKKYLQKILTKPIFDFEMIDPYYYHLDTCFSPLSNDVVVINPSSFRPEARQIIRTHFRKVIETTESADHKLLACNLVTINKQVVVGKGISTSLRNNFEQLGYSVHEVAMTEYLKGGGSVKCISLEIF